MTPEERAAAILRDHHLPDDDARLVACVAAAIRAAVEEEREACARVADDGRTVVSGISQEADTMARMIAAEIRWRKP